MNIQFAHPWILMLFWPALGFGLGWLILYRRAARRRVAFVAPALRAKLCPPENATRFYWQWACAVSGLLLMVVAAARPQWGTREETIFQRGRDLVIALDVSRSMLAQDVRPTRLQRAKTDIMDLIRALRGDRAALLVFRRKAVPICPLTTDYAFLEQALDAVSIESAPPGETDIGDAIDKALDAFENEDGAHRALVLISDGEDLSGRAKAAAERAAQKGVVLFTVGLGDPRGAAVPDAAHPERALTYRGEQVISRLEHETLKTIAETTGGAYVPVATANVKLGALYQDHLSRLAARDFEEALHRQQVERYQWFLAPALFLLLATAGFSRGRLARVKPRASAERPGVRPPPIPSSGAGAPPPRSVPNLSPGAGAPPPRSVLNVVPGTLTSLLLVLSVGADATLHAAPPTAAAPTIVRQTQGTNTAATQTVTAAADAAATQPAIPPGREGALHAQTLSLAGRYREAAEAYLQARKGVSGRLADDWLFNAGCAWYQAGEYRKAANTFAELAQRGETPVAAHYNRGCAAARMAETSADSNVQTQADALPCLEQAGQAFQRALRADPSHAAARDNLALVAQRLPEARQQAKWAKLMARYQHTPPAQLADLLLANQRRLRAELPDAVSNATPDRIRAFEALAGLQMTNSDLLLPLTAALDAALAGQSNAPAVHQHIAALRDVFLKTQERLEAIDAGAGETAPIAEAGAYQLWKGLASHDLLLREDLWRQTNAIALTTAPSRADAESQTLVHQQQEALELTRLFAARFTAAVPPEGIPAEPPTPPAGGSTHAAESGAATNPPLLSAETRARILALTRQAQSNQTQACAALERRALQEALPSERAAYARLKEIEALLPKPQPPPPDRQQQQEQQPQEQPSPPEQEQQPSPPEPQESKEPSEPKPQEPPASQPQPPEQPPPPAEQSQPEPAETEDTKKDKELSPHQAQALIEKALQREKEHQEERARTQYAPPSPIERDW